MFNLQFSEVVIILVLALILLGPKRLPQIARSVARGIREVRRAGQDLRETWETEVEQTAGPELRALRSLRDPGALVDSAWDGTEKASDAAPAETSETAAPVEEVAEGAPADASPAGETKTE